MICLWCSAGNLHELAVAGGSGSEQGIAALLTAACRSKALHLLDVRGLPLAGKVRAEHTTSAVLISNSLPSSCFEALVHL
jgi:hypothetical protein